MTTPSSGPSGFDHEQTSGGDADEVQKTSYVTGQGTDPSAQAPDTAIARVNPGGGMGVGGWVLIAVIVFIAIVYGFGFFR